MDTYSSVSGVFCYGYIIVCLYLATLPNLFLCPQSTHDRTLDQQCTVTRPGVSYLAAGHVTEMLVATLQHPDR